MSVRLTKLKCVRCEHKWSPRIEDVRMCPNCKSVRWNERKETELTAMEAVYGVFASYEMRVLTKMMLLQATDQLHAVKELNDTFTKIEQTVIPRLVGEGLVNSIDSTYFLSARGSSLGSMGLKCIVDLGIKLPWERTDAKAS